jgi:hypothetical protein
LTWQTSNKEPAVLTVEAHCIILITCANHAEALNFRKIYQYASVFAAAEKIVAVEPCQNQHFLWIAEFISG